MVVDEQDGRAIVVKAASGTAVARLTEEAERLRRASHPGVVEVLSAGPSAAGWELVTAHAGRSLEVVGAMTVGAIAHLGASLATTVADLHDLGVVHGRIDRSHVLVGDDGRAILCGFGPSDLAPEPTAADDVAAMGSLLTELLGSVAVAEVFPERRWALRRPHTEADRRALLVLADHACAEPPEARPTARRLAAALTDAAPRSARTPHAPQHRARGRLQAVESEHAEPMASLHPAVAEPRGPSSGRTLVLGGLGAALLLVAGLRSAETEESPAVDRSAGEVPAAPAASPAGGPDPTASSLVVEIDGRVARVGGRAYEIGQPGDEVVVGDWDCNGTPTPAVLRPRSGEVFTFATWGDGGAVVVEPAARVDGAARLVVGADGRCPGLWVQTAAGELVVIIEEGST